MDESKNILEMRNITVTYDDDEDSIPILNKLDFNVEKGKTVLLMGHNGCGKSTLLRTVIGLLKPHKGGEILFDGEPVRKKSLEKRVHLGMTYLSQYGGVFPSLTVKDNLEAANDYDNFWSLFLTKEKKIQHKERMDKVLGTFPTLKDILGKRVHKLSGGQKKLVAFAMRTMLPSKLIMLDEPTAGLDAARAQELMDTMQAVVKESGKTVLIVEHRLNLMQWVDLVAVLREGRIATLETDTSKLDDSDWLKKYYV